MTRRARFISFLDRYEERLDSDCERLKQQLITQVDQHFGALRVKVGQIKNGLLSGSVYFDHLFGGPPVEEIEEQRELMQQQDEQEVVTTASRPKRKSVSQSEDAGSTKRTKADLATTSGTNKYVCKFQECGKSFETDKDLARHERIHLGIKPFSCKWSDCSFSSEEFNNVAQHVRTQHFKLPKTKKEQERLNIVDDRDPKQYVRVDHQLAKRRLEWILLSD